MNNNQIELAANIGLIASVVLYVLWRVLPYSFALIAAYGGLISSLVTAIIAIIMMVKKTDGKGVTLHKIVLMIPLLWFMMNAVSYR